MRTTAATALAAGLLAVSLTAAPAGATTPTPTPTAPTSTPAPCPLDAGAATKGAQVIAEVVVSHPAGHAANGTLTAPVLIREVLKGPAKKAPATLVVAGTGCAAKAVQAAQPKDVLLVLGVLSGTQLQVNGAAASVLVGDQACQVERVLHKSCAEASTGVVLSQLDPSAPQPWLKIAAPGLAAIIVSVLGLLLLRLRRR